MAISFDGLSFNTANITTVAGSQASLSSAVLKQSLANATPATASFAPMTITVDDPAVAAARGALYNKAIGTPIVLAQDAKNVANALVPTMQSIASERPDLANAHFDFTIK
jgi:hypothetical protein